MKEQFHECLVLEIHRDYIIVLNDQGNLLKLNPKDGLKVGDHIYYLPQDIYKNSLQLIHGKKSKTLIKPIIGGLLIAATIFLFTLLDPSFQQEEVNAAISIGSDNGFQIVLDDQENILHYSDASQEHPLDQYVGKNLEDILPEISDKILSSEDLDILVAISSSNPQSKTKIQTSLLSYLNQHHNRKGLILVEGEIDDYFQASEEDQLLGDYQINKYNINLWQNDESRQLNQQEKIDRLKKNAEYIPYKKTIGEQIQTLNQAINKSSLIDTIHKYGQMGRFRPGNFNSGDNWFQEFYPERNNQTPPSPVPNTHPAPTTIPQEYDDDDEFDDDVFDDDFEDDLEYDFEDDIEDEFDDD